SVVKELVENALDAEARVIGVDLRDGGATLVRVTDDGFGMSADELALALERHATSKLATDDDLDAIATLGFRGEALPAICAVSRFVVTSRARGAPDGTRVAGEGDAITQRLAVACDTGTTVEVRDLFFNTPARLKFLKAGSTEVAASLRVVTQLAIALPAADVDANVHPTKAWVRFRHPRLVHEMVVAAVGGALRRDAVMPVLTPPSSTTPTGITFPISEDTRSSQAVLFAEAPAPYGA